MFTASKTLSKRTVSFVAFADLATEAKTLMAYSSER
jgi:hypothetical protein